MSTEDLKILQKAYDMVQYGYTALRQFPKSERHVLAAEIRATMVQILRLIRRRTKLKIRRRLNDLQKLYARGRVELRRIRSVLASYIGHLRHCDSYRLRKRLMDEFVLTRSD